jgi:hypothetical protein
MWRKVVSNYRVALDTAAIVGAIVGLRAILFAAGVDGMSLSPLTSSIVAGGVFVMGLVVAGTLSDYKDADRRRANWPPSCTPSCGNASRCTPRGAGPTWACYAVASSAW